MTQLQAIFAQSAATKFSTAESIGNAVTQAAEWLGRTVTYIANVVCEYAVKAWDYGVSFFGVAMEVVQNNQQAFSYVGAAATVGAVLYVLAKVLGTGTPKQPNQQTV